MDIVPPNLFVLSTLLHHAPNPAYSALSSALLLGAVGGRPCSRLSFGEGMELVYLTPEYLQQSCHGKRCASLKTYSSCQGPPQLVTLLPHPLCALTCSSLLIVLPWSHLCGLLFNTSQMTSFQSAICFPSGPRPIPGKN